MGIWLIVYRIQAGDQDEYLQWFHDVHIGEKLARPGYDWAAHYKVAEQAGDTGNAGSNQYIAMFGGQSTRVFYDPSPLQLKPTQDELTRKMIGCRCDVNMFIAATEWCTPAAVSGSAVTADNIRLGMFADTAGDQIISAFCAQQLFPELDREAACRSVSKLLSSTGTPRHLVLQEIEAPVSPPPQLDWSTMEGCPDIDVVSASRIWPVQV